MNKKLLLFIILAGVAGLFLFVKTGKTQVRVLEKDNLGYPFWIAQEKGYLRGVKYQKVTIPDSIENGKDRDKAADELLGWVKDNADVAVLSVDEYVNLETKYPGSFKAMAFVVDSESEFSSSLIVKKGSSIKSVKDLGGKRIAAESLTEHYFFELFTSKSGVKEYTPRRIKREDVSVNLAGDKIDAAWVTEPYATKLIKDGVGEVLVSNPVWNPKTEVSGAPSNVIVISSDFVKNNQRKAKKIKAGILKATKVKKEEQEVVMTEALGDKWREVILARTFAKVEDASAFNKDLLKKMITGMVKGKYINKEIDFSGLIY